MMLNIGSPHFSTCSKADLLNRLSPSFRSKRVPSAQDNYTQSNSNLHKNLLRKQSSPSKLSEKSKRSRSRKATSTSNCINKTTDGSIVAEVNYLKQQYHSLKNAYHELIQQKIRSAKSYNALKEQNTELQSENERILKESDKLKSKVSFLELEIERIKRQCMKLVQLEQFKSKRLQQNLKEKQETIRALMTMSDQLGDRPQIFERIKSLVSCDSKHFNEESLMISQDKPFSVHNRNQSQFISISLTSMMEDDHRNLDMSIKRKPIQNKENKNCDNLKKNRCQQKKVIGQRIFYTQGQNIEQEQQNMRKIRKQLNRKLQINVDERTKDHIVNPLKTPVSHDRKNSKLKNSKSKSKKSEDDQSARFMKKKHK